MSNTVLVYLAGGVTLLQVLLYIVYKGGPLNRHTKSLALYEGNISPEHLMLQFVKGKHFTFHSPQT